MEQCPRCGGSAEPDPEHVGVIRCMSCWQVCALPQERPCPGHRPVLIAALRTLEESRDLRR
ncbi:hypothetical protein DVH02_21370 [Streptomyces corynorhini]|uniref:Uncharacterized protein n=1 Tax=Streptomyces corynorhini TaxID=2282652 RepID=A0A370B8W9_9ACTN|nr:hypothetical protein DVH02_21370 [Streptomyces corynorhini]